MIRHTYTSCKGGYPYIQTESSFGHDYPDEPSIAIIVIGEHSDWPDSRHPMQ